MSYTQKEINVGDHVYSLSNVKLNVVLTKEGTFSIFVRKVAALVITRNECLDLVKISHENVQRILQHVNEDKFHYLVAEASQSLPVYLGRKRKINFIESLRLMKDVTKGLNHLHDNGILHKNLSPDNIIIGGNMAKIANFGIIDFNHEKVIQKKLR